MSFDPFFNLFLGLIRPRRTQKQSAHKRNGTLVSPNSMAIRFW
jgi:hypothetical protein